MAAAAQSAWAVDIGNNSLKALRLHAVGDEVEVIGLDYIEHGKILSSPNITQQQRSEIIAETLRTFAQRNNIGVEDIAMSVPGQSSFARFVKLPPVEPKRVPEIVRFEAVQQIPFDINEVEWDWQVMEKPDSPDVEVGIFAIKNDLVSGYLENFSSERLKITLVQMAPIALYNYIHYDSSELDSDDGKAIVVLDMGAENTDLIVCTKSSLWQRCIPLGGNAFTNAIAEAFKLKFSKAEKLKRGAVMSKYARQIFHSMRPVFTDFAAEIQRSLGYYSNVNQDVDFSKIIVLGGGFKLQGLVKYLGQTLQLPIVRPDSFEKLSVGADVSSAKLHENIADFGVVYGLGLQALGRAKIETNLLPGRIAKAMAWVAKSRYFTIAAGMLLIISFMSFAKTSYDKKAYFSKDARSNREQITRVIQQSRTAKQWLEREEKRDSEYEQVIKRYLDVFKYRDTIPILCETMIKCLPNAENNPEQKQVYEAFEKKDIAALLRVPRRQRKQLFVTRVSMDYYDSLLGASLDNLRRQVKRSSRGTSAAASSARGTGGGMGGMMMPGMGGAFPMPGGGAYGPPTRKGKGPRKARRGARRGTAAEAEKKLTPQDGSGFVVIIEGYSPYEKIDELLDPVGVGNDKSRWGYVTRLMNLDDLAADGNSPFKLFAKEFAHFRLDTGVVQVDAGTTGMPDGIGIRQEKTRGLADEKSESGRTAGPATANINRRTKAGAGADTKITTETVLIDPMTKEEISKTYDLNEKGEIKYNELGEPVYIVRDHWFRIRVKLLWKDA
ncbi:MAG: type IV pilus assembly protein PilM, partial [Planctomycetes bacterium]|nr:type IV pilus assembly protein PilM [Planctomycetota bacterium]